MPREVLKSPQLLEKVLDIMPVGVWILNRLGDIVYVNPAGKSIWAGAKYIGVDQFGEYRGWWRHNGEPIPAEEWAAARAITRGETTLNEEVDIQSFDGSRKAILNSALPIRNEQGDIVGAVCVNVDVTERIRFENMLKEMAHTDALTRAYTRRRFHELLDDELARAQRYGHPFSLIMFDIDRFKLINDTHGHAAGDEVLGLVSQQVRLHIRSTDYFARYGGDEFVILLPETLQQEARALAEKLRQTLERECVPQVGAISCSFGVYQYRDGDTAEQMLREVDAALYQAKGGGRNRVESRE